MNRKRPTRTREIQRTLMWEGRRTEPPKLIGSPSQVLFYNLVRGQQGMHRVAPIDVDLVC